MNRNDLQKTIYDAIISFATTEGINASGRDEIYGCIFGRDSAITILKVLRVCAHSESLTPHEKVRLLTICRTALLTLTSLQGQATNIESGEEPGKFIHEFRRDKYDHLLSLSKPWYVYPDGILRNYDSIDSTPLALIAIYRYYQATKDTEFLLTVMPSVEKGLNWIITYGDKDKDFLLEYELPVTRKFGGLPVQSWTDSHESILREDGTMPPYPIAPVEVQGYAWLALKLWARFYSEGPLTHLHSQRFALNLLRFAKSMKRQFNKVFLFESAGHIFPAQALDGNKKQIRTVTGNPLLLLWASYRKNGKRYSILYRKHIPELIARAFEKDMFEKDAGIRTMSTESATFNPRQDSYHNGSFWPKLNGMAHEGLHMWGYHKRAEKLKVATLAPIMHFGSPIELYVKNEHGEFLEFRSLTGQVSCRYQAWSAATALDLLAIDHKTVIHPSL